MSTNFIIIYKQGSCNHNYDPFLNEICHAKPDLCWCTTTRHVSQPFATSCHPQKFPADCISPAVELHLAFFSSPVVCTWGVACEGNGQASVPIGLAIAVSFHLPQLYAPPRVAHLLPSGLSMFWCMSHRVSLWDISMLVQFFSHFLSHLAHHGLQQVHNTQHTIYNN